MDAEGLYSSLCNAFDRASKPETIVAMYAIVRPSKKSDFELRLVQVDDEEATREFDAELIVSGFGPYMDKDVRLNTFERSLEERGTIGVIETKPKSIVASNECDENGMLDSLVELAYTSQNNFMSGNIKELKSKEIPYVIGLLFAYSGDSESNTFYAFQKVKPSAKIDKARLLYRISGKANFTLISNEALRVDKRFDLIIIDHNVFALDPNMLVTHFGFNEVLKNKALGFTNSLTAITSSVDVIIDRIEAGRIRTIKKLARLNRHGSPVLKISLSNLRNSLETLKEYKGKFKFSPDGRIKIDSPEEIDMFLKMLNDEILISRLTNTFYESEIKDPSNELNSELQEQSRHIWNS